MEKCGLRGQVVAKAEQPALPWKGRGKPRGMTGEWCCTPARDLCCSPTLVPPHQCCCHGAANSISRPGQDSRVCGGLASLEEKTWPYLELVELGTTGPHEVLHRPVHRDKVLGASVGQGQSHPPTWGTNMHNKSHGSGGRDSWARTKGLEYLRGSNNKDSWVRLIQEDCSFLDCVIPSKAHQHLRCPLRRKPLGAWDRTQSRSGMMCSEKLKPGTSDQNISLNQGVSATTTCRFPPCYRPFVMRASALPCHTCCGSTPLQLCLSL